MKKKILSVLLSASIITALMPIAYAVDWGSILHERTQMVNETDFELIMEGNVENAPFYGAKFEPRGGSYIGSTADTMEEYMPLGGFLTYVESFRQGDLYYPGKEIVAKNNLLVMVGWTVDSFGNVDYNGIYHTLTTLNDYNKPMFIRFANEMNVSSLGNDAQKYVEIFRTVADMVHEFPNLAVVWSPNDIGALDRPFERYYPGDEYVDWIGVSCYSQQYFQGDHNTSQKDSIYFMTGDNSWATNRLKPIIKFMEDYGIEKPLMISEGGVATSAGETWTTPRLRNMLYSVLMKYPQVKMINYFNVYRYDEEEKYNLTGHPYAMRIFNEAADSGGYIRKLFDNPRFVFHKPVDGDTVVADMNENVNFYTLAYIPKSPDITVNYSIDGTWVHSSDEAPYKFTFDLGSISEGEHTITIESGRQNKSYKFVKRNHRIIFGSKSSTDNISNIPMDKSKGNDVRVFVKKNNGDTSEIEFDEQYPMIVDGFTLVPLRNIFEGMDTPVEWNDDTKTVQWDTCTMEIGASTIGKLVDISYGKNNRHHTTVRESIDLAVPAQIMNGRTMVPLRAIAESTGYNVNWDSGSRIVTITI